MGYCQCPGSILVCSGAVVGRDEARACSKTHDARLNMLSIGATRLRVQSESVHKNRTPECNPARLPQKPPETPLPAPHHLACGPYPGDTGARAVRSARRAVRLAHPERQARQDLETGVRLDAAPWHAPPRSARYTLPRQRPTPPSIAASEKTDRWRPHKQAWRAAPSWQ